MEYIHWKNVHLFQIWLEIQERRGLHDWEEATLFLIVHKRLSCDFWRIHHYSGENLKVSWGRDWTNFAVTFRDLWPVSIKGNPNLVIEIDQTTMYGYVTHIWLWCCNSLFKYIWCFLMGRKVPHYYSDYTQSVIMFESDRAYQTHEIVWVYSNGRF